MGQFCLCLGAFDWVYPHITRPDHVTCERLLTLPRPRTGDRFSDLVTSLVWSKDGNYLAAGSINEILEVYRITPVN